MYFLLCFMPVFSWALQLIVVVLFGCFALAVICLPCAFFAPFVVDLLLFVLVGFH